MKEKQKVEALRRMEKMELDSFLIETFKKGSLTLCETFHNITTEDFIVLASEIKGELLEKIRKLEERYNFLVYTVIKTQTDIGDLYDLIYVSKYEEEWDIDEALLEDNVVMSYCINITTPYFSEFGTIGIESKNGGLHRIL